MSNRLPNPRSKQRAPWGDGLRRFLTDRVATCAAITLILVIVVVLLANVLAPQDPDLQDLNNKYASPALGSEHLLGTDRFGRDLFSRLLYGGRSTILATLLATTVGIVIGVPAGLLAGYFGRWIDPFLSRIFDGIFAVPSLIVAIAVIALVGPGLVTAMIAVGVVFSPGFFRVTRAATRTLRHEAFIESSVCIGCSVWRIVGIHILPNALPPLIVQTTVTMGHAVMAEASLSFLGLGTQPPTASWGSMLSTGFADAVVAPHLMLAPGIAITVVVLALTQAGEGVRRATGRGLADEGQG